MSFMEDIYHVCSKMSDNQIINLVFIFLVNTPQLDRVLDFIFFQRL